MLPSFFMQQFCNSSVFLQPICNSKTVIHTHLLPLTDLFKSIVIMGKNKKNPHFRGFLGILSQTLSPDQKSFILLAYLMFCNRPATCFSSTTRLLSFGTRR